MPRRIVVPPAVNKLTEVQGWGVFRHPPTSQDSPLWVCLKIINLGALHRRHRRGLNRTFWLYWSLDERRLRRSAHRLAFEAQQPAVFSATVRWLEDEFTPTEMTIVEMRLGDVQLAEERARLLRSRTVRAEHDRRRAAEAAAAAAVGAADTDTALGPPNPRPLTLDDLM